MGAVVVFVWRKGAEEIQLDLFRSGAQRQPGIVVGEQGLQVLFWKMIICESESSRQSENENDKVKKFPFADWMDR